MRSVSGLLEWCALFVDYRYVYSGLENLCLPVSNIDFSIKLMIKQIIKYQDN